jgi:hypothetical protein
MTLVARYAENRFAARDGHPYVSIFRACLRYGGANNVRPLANSALVPSKMKRGIARITGPNCKIARSIDPT